MSCAAPDGCKAYMLELIAVTPTSKFDKCWHLNLKGIKQEVHLRCGLLRALVVEEINGIEEPEELAG